MSTAEFPSHSTSGGASGRGVTGGRLRMFKLAYDSYRLLLLRW